MGLKFGNCDTDQRDGISVCIGDNGSNVGVRRVIIQHIGHASEDRLVQLDRVIVDVEVRDRVGPEPGAEKIRIRPIATRQRVTVSTDQDIGAISAEERIVSSRAINNVWTIATVQCCVYARKIAYTRVEYDYA